MRHDRISRATLAMAAAMALAGSATKATTFLETGTIVDFVVPTTGVYAITAWGAAGGGVVLGSGPIVDAGGIGGELGGTFHLVGGHSIELLVGQQGRNGYYPGGGGGTFVYDATSATLIVAAGAGGGANDSSATTTGSSAPGGNAQAGTSGGAGDYTPAYYPDAGGAGGTNGGGGAGGFATCCSAGGGGGGFSGNGGGGGYNGSGGISFLNGGAGDNFGGGGNGGNGGSGGGGGYSGGGGGGLNGIGGGGGSYLDTALLVPGTALPFQNAYEPTLQIDLNGYVEHNGEVIIAPAAVPEPATWALLIAGFGGVGAMARRRRAVAAGALPPAAAPQR